MIWVSTRFTPSWPLARLVAIVIGSWDLAVPLSTTRPPTVFTTMSVSFNPLSEAMAALTLPVVTVSLTTFMLPVDPVVWVVVVLDDETSVLGVVVVVVVVTVLAGCEGVLLAPELLYALLVPDLVQPAAAARTKAAAQGMRRFMTSPVYGMGN